MIELGVRIDEADEDRVRLFASRAATVLARAGLLRPGDAVVLEGGDELRVSGNGGRGHETIGLFGRAEPC